MKWAPTSLPQLIAAELALLRASITNSAFRSSRIPLISGNLINTVEAYSKHPAGSLHAPPHPPAANSTPLVLAHGFGAGLGLWGASIDALVRDTPGRRVVAFDWLGMGGSSRPSSFTKRRGCHAAEVVDEAEEFFCDSMLEWADALELQRFDLLGHSLGGYLATVFALRHPDRVRNLVLASPVGIPSPLGLQHAKETIAKVTRETEHAVDDSVPAVSLTDEEVTVDHKHDTDRAMTAGIPQDVWRRMPWQMRAIVRAWEFNVTPQMVLRALGSFGPRVARGLVSGRFGNSVGDKAMAELVSDYLYHVTASPGSGEFAMNALLAPRVVDGRPGVYARRPLGPALAQLDKIPTTILFGSDDWMAHPDVAAIVDCLPHVKLHTIRGAGHHLYMDNPPQFQAAVAAGIRSARVGSRETGSLDGGL